MRSRFIHAGMAVLVMLPATLTLRAQPATDATQPQPTLLEQLNRETERLYHDVGRGLLRVQLPAQAASNEDASERSPLAKYKQLDPKVREELEQRRRSSVAARTNAAPPTTGIATDVRLDAGAALIVVAPPAPARKADAAEPAFAPNSVGLLLDAHGHVLVPQHVDPDAAADHPIRVSGADGAVTLARLVGSDRQTNLAVLKLPAPAGTPVRLADGPPREGSLVLLVSPADAAGRLSLWTGGGGRDVAVVFPVDGQCAGIARSGQFLGGRACRLIAEQIVRHGSVRRATLGIIISEIRRDDPLRQRQPALADRGAVRVDQVMPASPAEKAGVRAGDLLLAMAGEPVHDIPTLAAAIAARTGPTELRLLRGDEMFTISVDLQQK